MRVRRSRCAPGTAGSVLLLWLAFFTVAAASAAALAQGVGETAVEAGRLPVDAGPPGGAAEEPDGAQDPTVFVRRFRFEGNTAFSDDELSQLLRSMTGRSLRLVDLQMAAYAVEMHYRANGYFVAEAVLVPQEIVDGEVEIWIFEGEYDQIVLHNESRLKDSVARALLQLLEPDTPILADPYERAVLLLSDLSGIAVSTSLDPGSRTGTADLHVYVRDAALTEGTVTMGFSAEEPVQDASVSWAMDVNNVTGRGDQLGAMLSVSGELRSLELQYTLPTAKGLSYGAKFSTSQRRVEAFGSLHIETWVHNGSLSASYALRRAYASNRTLTVSYEYISSGRDVVGFVTGEKRHRLNVGISANASAAPDRESRYALQVTYGIAVPEIGSDYAYQKVGGAYTYSRQLGQRVRFAASLSAQLGLSELDSTERMDIGGSGGVRAFAGGVEGESGWLGRLEMRRVLSESVGGTWQGVGFVEGGGVWNPSAAEGSGYHQRWGFGTGLAWSFPRGGALQLERAWPIGPADAEAGRGRLWLRLVFQY